jgi:hypothetical protein
MVTLRNAVGLATPRAGWYSLADFAAGIVPPCRWYVFANAFCLDSDQRRALTDRLRREGAHALWVYAPGYLQPDGPDLAAASLLTGMTLQLSPGQQGTVGTGPLAGLNWGTPVEVVPRLSIADAGVEALGHYQADSLVSAARTDAPGYDSVFLADISLTTQVLQRLFAGQGQ